VIFGFQHGISFQDLLSETLCQEQSNPLKNSDSLSGDLHLHLDEHVPGRLLDLCLRTTFSVPVPSEKEKCLLEGSQLLSGQFFIHGGLCIPPQV
jgi:hypothetical protein